MKAIVLCGGRGERLMPMTEDKPAVLLRLCGKELIYYILDTLKEAGFEKVTLAVGYGSKQIAALFDRDMYCGMKIEFSHSDGAGTADAVYKALGNDEQALVIEGNCLFNCDLKKFMEFHSEQNAVCSVMTKKCENNENCICVSVEDKIASAVMREPSADKTGFENCMTGIYIINKGIFDDYNCFDRQDLAEDVITAAVSDLRDVCVYSDEFYWERILTPKGFLKCQRDILFSDKLRIRKLTEGNFSGATLIAPLYIGKNVTIMPGAVVEKGAVIDDNAVIKRGCRVTGSYVGVNCIVSENSELEEAVICGGAKLGRGVKCRSCSVVGTNSSVGAEAVIEKEVRIWSGRRIDGGSRLYKNVQTGRARKTIVDEEGECSLGGGQAGAEELVRFGIAAGTAVNIGEHIAVAYGGEEHNRILQQALVSGICSAGANVFDLGNVTLPQLMYAVKTLDCKFGIYVGINASGHIRVTAPCGLPVDRDTELAIEKSYNERSFRMSDFRQYGRVMEHSAGEELYIRFVDSVLPSGFSGVNAEIRTSDTRAAVIADRLFHGRNDIDGEKIIFHLSAQSDKCTAYTELTGYVGWERLVNLCAKIRYEKGRSVSVPYCFSSAADILAESEGGRLYRYYSSSCGEDAEARSAAAEIGNMFVNDGLYLAACICGYLSEKEMSLYSSLKNIPDVYSTQRYVTFGGKSGRLMEKLAAESAVSGEGMIYGKDNSRAVIRPLRNGNGVMIFAEGASSEFAAALCDELQHKIKSLENEQGLS